MNIGQSERAEILRALDGHVTKWLKDRHLDNETWADSLHTMTPAILSADGIAEFETAVSNLLKKLGVSHVGFYSADLKRCSAKMALCATYDIFPDVAPDRWTFQDVHEEGPAHLAGVRPGDTLLAVEAKGVRSPRHPIFEMPSSVSVSISSEDNQARQAIITIPQPRRKNQLPFAEPKNVVHSQLFPGGIGYVKIAMFPGSIGIDVANEIEQKVDNLGLIHSLVVDLRGNSGGGLGFLRLISMLTPSDLLVGEFVSRSVNTLKQPSPAPILRIDHIPRNRLGIISLAARYGAASVSAALLRSKVRVQLAARGVGKRSFHGRVIFLVNRHTASASEMLAACVMEHGLATLVGEPTAGRVTGGGKRKLPHSYWLVLPTGSYETQAGVVLEGAPLQPHIQVPFSPIEARAGRDPQLMRAMELALA